LELAHLYGGSWLEGAGAVFAENQALKVDFRFSWHARNMLAEFLFKAAQLETLSALVTARNTFREKTKRCKQMGD
jgi:L-2,4-diaminobutyrate decarboxylase